MQTVSQKTENKNKKSQTQIFVICWNNGRI